MGFRRKTPCHKEKRKKALNKEKLHILTESAYTAYHYALKRKRRFRDGEQIISTSPEWSFKYAVNVLQDRFELGEKSIAKNNQWSYEYARQVLHKRFLLGEPKILESPYYCIENILVSYMVRFNSEFDVKDRIKFESKIANHGECSYDYALKLGSRFYRGEEAISKSAYWSYYYAYNVIQGRFELGELAIARDAGYACSYAVHVLNSRFPLGERVMASNFDIWSFYEETFLHKEKLEWSKYGF